MTEAVTTAPDWARLAKALAFEAQGGYMNLQGKTARFDAFMANAFAGARHALPAAEAPHAHHLAAAFAGYDALPQPEREALVARARSALSRWMAPPEPVASGSKRGRLNAPEDFRDTPVQFVKGIGPRIAELLVRLGVLVVDDLVRHYPREVIDYQKRVRIGALKAGEQVTVWGTIRKVEAYNPPARPNMSILTVWISDGTGTVASRFFGKSGNKFMLEQLKKRFPTGQDLLLSGTPKLDGYSGRIVFDRPETQLLGDLSGAEEESALHVGRLVPIYGLTEGLHLKTLRKAIRSALDAYLPNWPDPLPRAFKEHYGLWPLKQALETIHFPRSAAEREEARKRLVFDELFWMQLGLGYRRKAAERELEALALPTRGELVTKLLDTVLPFRLTGAQARVFAEIQADLASPRAMNRLVQGDVGSGKTVVALLALLVAVENGYQGALMAPTEILAEQHHRKLKDWVEALGLRCELLVGKQTKKRRAPVLEAIAEGEVSIVVGTHALIQDAVAFKNLGLVVIDEQHRFGVKQRARLRAKGRAPEVLSMTATPIPRTLALTVHGDLDVSVIDELPPGRTPIETAWARTAGEAKAAWKAVREQIAQGRQAYVVYPLVAETEKLDIKAATEEAEHLRHEVFPDLVVGLLHGQMAPAEKDAVFAEFRAGRMHILVATTVIEVGVDVPNATVMVIEHAERFGLAQLHQLRGRVGRGAHQSYCYLISNSRSDTTAQRLGIMEQTNDGFVIAEQDLKLRGPGEFLGTRQSGLPDLVLADLVSDTALLEQAREAAFRVLDRDPTLAEHPALKRDLFRYFKANLSFLEA